MSDDQPSEQEFALAVVCVDMSAELELMRALLADLRPVVERAEWVFSPPKGTCIWGGPDKAALLARLDALVQP